VKDIAHQGVGFAQVHVRLTAGGHTGSILPAVLPDAHYLLDRNPENG
jgi:hypothetical protein